MPDDSSSSSHLGPDEAVKREQAERLLADIYDVIVLLMGAYAAKVLKTILPYSPYMLPPDVVAHHLSKLGILHDTIMAWTTEALEHAGEPHRAAREAVPIFVFQRLVDLGRQDAEVRAGLDSATLSVKKAASQLAVTRPNTKAWYDAWRVLGEAISQLLDASTRLMELEDVQAGLRRIERIQIEAGPPVRKQPMAASRFRRGVYAAGQRFEAAADKTTWRPEGSVAAQAHHALHPQAPANSPRRADDGPRGATGPAGSTADEDQPKHGLTSSRAHQTTDETQPADPGGVNSQPAGSGSKLPSRTVSTKDAGKPKPSPGQSMSNPAPGSTAKVGEQAETLDRSRRTM